MFCQNCGQQISEDSCFCEHCGTIVEQDSAVASPEPLRAPAPPASPKMPGGTTYSETSARPAAKKKIIFIMAIMVIIFAVIAVGVWFLKGWLDDDKPAAYVPNQDPPYTEQSGHTPSNDARPTIEDFGWYEDVFKNGVWSGANPVTELPYILGGWKCYIVYDPYRNMDSYAQELANVDIEGVQSGISLTVDWYRMYWDGEAPHDESDMEDSVFTGSYKDGELYLTGAGNISLDSFYEYEGVYYGFGSMLTQDGITADFCLMR